MALPILMCNNEQGNRFRSILYICLKSSIPTYRLKLINNLYHYLKIKITSIQIIYIIHICLKYKQEYRYLILVNNFSSLITSSMKAGDLPNVHIGLFLAINLDYHDINSQQGSINGSRLGVCRQMYAGQNRGSWLNIPPNDSCLDVPG